MDDTVPTRPSVEKVEEGPVLRDSAFADGTYHQSQLSPDAVKSGLFARPDPVLAEAVNKDADTVDFTEAEEKAVRRKIDKRVLTLVILSYVFNQFDRTNIGNAHVITEFNENFGVTSNSKWTVALSIFYVGYCLLEMPANVLQRHIGANRFFFMSMVFWGFSSLSFVYAKGYGALLALRVLLGIGEAGYYAGMIYYLSFWYKRSELALRVSLCMTGTLPGAIGGLLAFGLVRAHTPLLKGWQFLFLIEAIPTLIMAVALLFFLPSFPFASSFLSPRERAIAQARLNRDHRPTSHGGMTGWEGFKAIVNDPHSWMLVVVYTSFNMGVATISYFLPTLIKELGFDSLSSQGLTVAPYAVGWFMVVFQAMHSDRTRDRGYHIMLSTGLATIGYIILAALATKGNASNYIGGRYFALFLVVGGLFSLFPLVMSWAANIFSPTSKRGVGTAFIVSISNTVSIAAPQIYFDSKENFQKGHAIAAGCVFLSFCAAFALRTRLAHMNRKNAEKVREMGLEREKPAQGAKEEVWDNDPRYVFMT
ncbi:MFS general substrate transporter [Epithele typhae]|uniref:MFS general substrate transporter n=1 Tax=Epithele typhae TaxID=378194 RepID=UPI0020079520|nr:MFS general substrate transporter [Epithele typhae]KAH9929023.1 MFS general substrate transporter [Epithele typhae]